MESAILYKAIKIVHNRLLNSRLLGIKCDDRMIMQGELMNIIGGGE
jgi:hypothetical protein